MAIVIGPFGSGNGVGEDLIRSVPVRVGELLSWGEARAMLDYEFNQGFGAPPQCDAIYAWTDNKVLVVVEYDGSTGVQAIPPNPVPSEARMMN